MIDTAFKKLYELDIYLITHESHDLSNGQDGHVSERGIVARFAIYLHELLLNNKEYKKYDLDVEYNRNMDKPKHLPHTEWQNNGAYPDLIIHKRGSNDSNILIIEFKTYWNNNENKIETDLKKLKAFMKEPYFYENAMFVMLNRDAPKRRWINENTTLDELFSSIKVDKK